MNKRIVYLTSYFPFGKYEVWTANEINSLLNLDNEIIIIPRTGKGRIINSDLKKFSSNVIDLPFIDWNIFIYLFKFIFFRFFLFFKLIIAIINHSNNIIDFAKGIIVLPKSIYLSKILKFSSIDHIHSFSTTSSAVMAFIISSIIKVPWSYTIHTSEKFKPKFKRSFLFQSQSATICRTISQKTADDLADFIGPTLSKKIAMVHLGVNIKNVNEYKTTLNDPFIIVTPAELTYRKGHIYSIEAAKKLIDLGVTNFKWYFFGNGPLLDNLQDDVKRLGLTKHCYFLGNIDHQQLLSKYENGEVDFVVISSISTKVPEGIPVSLMEAMSYEIPVIASDCGGTKELVDGQTGILVVQNDSEVIANSIFELIEKPVYRKKIGKNGRNKVLQDFNTLKNADEILRLFSN